jgi:hypothetical protein
VLGGGRGRGGRERDSEEEVGSGRQSERGTAPDAQ